MEQDRPGLTSYFTEKQKEVQKTRAQSLGLVLIPLPRYPKQSSFCFTIAIWTNNPTSSSSPTETKSSAKSPREAASPGTEPSSWRSCLSQKKNKRSGSVLSPTQASTIAKTCSTWLTNAYRTAEPLESSCPGNSLGVQWLELRTCTAEGEGSIPGWGIEILQNAQCSPTSP